MDLFDFPSTETWKERSHLIASMLQDAERWPSYLMSDHATALFMDMQKAYCAGAWLSVIIMSISVIDAHLRDTEAMNPSLGTAMLLKEYYRGPRIDWLRKLRNTYVHADFENPVFGMNYWFDNQKTLEDDATIAMQMTVNALFQSGGT